MIGDEKYLQRRKYIPALQKAVAATFTDGDWKEFGYETDSINYVTGHSRLLRSLSWGDPDYEGCVFSALGHIIEDHVENFNILIGKEKVKKWLKSNKPDAYTELYKDSAFVSTFKPKKISPKEAVKVALKDAELFIEAGNPVSAVDRAHTALHGYLAAICDENELDYPDDAGITKLYKIVRDNSIDLGSEGVRANDIKKVLNSLSACVDAVNTLRNHASVAHPNEELLEEAEATLAINAIRTLLHYLEAKIK